MLFTFTIISGKSNLLGGGANENAKHNQSLQRGTVHVAFHARLAFAVEIRALAEFKRLVLLLMFVTGRGLMKHHAILLSIMLLLALGLPNHQSAQTQNLRNEDLKDVLITMKQENRVCLHCFPEYEVSISGDGQVTYKGIDAVVTGKHVYSIPKAQVKKLVAEFYKVDFFSFKNRYPSISNNGADTIEGVSIPVITSIRIKGQTKKVFNFSDAPEKLKELQKKIYEISRVERYIKRRLFND